MNRRRFLKSTAAISFLPVPASQVLAQAARGVALNAPARRVRPGDSAWPSEAEWNELKRTVEGRLIKVESPLVACEKDPDSDSCREVLRRLKNPYYIGDQPGLTQTSGWLDAWMSVPSVYAVAAAKTADVVAAVNFARDRHLRLVIKGGGHSYKGTSSSADSLLVWTRAMNQIVMHDAFVPQGCAGQQAPEPAVTVGAGAMWMQAYDAVTTKAGRYVQGGGCTTVGVAGLVQSGGFGSFSKNYGTAAAGLLEAEIVTADGIVRIANACVNPDLFWGIKGGGGGSLGVVTKMTLKTRELPDYFGGTFGTIRATSDAGFRRLTARFVRFYQEQLFNGHWGEQVAFEPGNKLRISMVFQGLNRQQAEGIWQPFVEWVTKAPRDFAFEAPLVSLEIPARHFWDAAYMKTHFSQFVVSDDRLGAPGGNVFWIGDAGQVGFFIHAYRSLWLPDTLLRASEQGKLSDALIAGSRHASVSLHFNKGLAGASPEVLAAAKDTAMNPAVLTAFALAIIASGGPPAFPGMPGPKPDSGEARRRAARINSAMNAVSKVVKVPGSYVSESDFFERPWQRSFWGEHYSRLAAVKRKYDPDGLFFVHQGVGSEEWSPDGFSRTVARR